jgi:predicted nucleic-acid-binding protein
VKALDTNVLVRLLVADDAGQADRAAAYIERHCTVQAPCWLNRIVLCELVWVLDRAYGYGRSDIATALEKLLRTAQFMAEDSDIAWAALRAYREGGDFADTMIALTNQRNGCDATATFDGNAMKRNGFEPV